MHVEHELRNKGTYKHEIMHVHALTIYHVEYLTRIGIHYICQFGLSFIGR